MFNRIKDQLGITLEKRLFKFGVFDKAVRNTQFEHETNLSKGIRSGINASFNNIDYKLVDKIGISVTRNHKIIYEKNNSKIGIKNKVKLFAYFRVDHCPTYATPSPLNVSFEHSIIQRNKCDVFKCDVGISSKTTGNSIDESIHMPIGIGVRINISKTPPIKWHGHLGIFDRADYYKITPLIANRKFGIYNRVRLVGLYVDLPIGIETKINLSIDKPTVKIGNNNCLENLYINRDENGNSLNKAGEAVILPNGEYHEPAAVEGKQYTSLIKAKCVKG